MKRTGLQHFPSEEYRLLERLKRFCHYTPSPRYPLGVGDDAALRRCGAHEQLIITGDTLVEHVHFSLDYMSLKEVGYKALAANLSDCAAMGAVPDAALVQVVFPKSERTVTHAMKSLYAGMHKACKEWDFPLVGGDVSQGPCWIIAVSLTGRKDEKARILTRTGARVGNTLWVTGMPGRSAAGLTVLKKWGRRQYPGEYRDLVRAHVAPRPRINAGLKLAEDSSVHAVIDLSDGIAKECYTLCYENRVGMELYFSHIGDVSSLEKLAQRVKRSWHEWFLYGGEDYELLFTASKQFDPACYTTDGIQVYEIGTVTDTLNTVMVFDANGHAMRVEKKAWDHVKR